MNTRTSGSKSPGAAKRKATQPRKRRSTSRPGIDLNRFMQQAYMMELEACERYAEFADAMDVANNKEVAALFRKMSAIERKHAEQIMARMGWATPPLGVPPFRWQSLEGAETGEHDELHYLMQPFHALQIALKNERRAAQYFASLTEKALPREILEAAQEMAEEEREHVRLVKEWIARVPRPEAGWDYDPDPPSYFD